MTTDETITDGLEEMQERMMSIADSYETRLIDFAKWTSTLTVGAMLWIANSFSTLSPEKLTMTIVALFLLAISLFLSLGLGAMVLFARNLQLKGFRHTSHYLVAQDLRRRLPSLGSETSEYLQTLEKGQRKGIEAFRASAWWSSAMGSWGFLVVHLSFLFLGVGMYAFLQVRYVLTFASPLSP